MSGKEMSTMENISVKIDGKKVVCEKGITYFELAKSCQWGW